MSTVLNRLRLLAKLQSAPAIASILAPAGWGKTALLEAAANSDMRLVRVALGDTEGHPSLLVDAVAQGLRKAFAGTAIGAVRTAAGLRSQDAPALVLERVREALGVSTLTLAFDEVERLPRGPVFDMLVQLCRARPEGQRYVFTSRQTLPVEFGVDPSQRVLGAGDLGFTLEEVERLVHLADPSLEARPLARSVLRETGGWPALVSARLRTSMAVEAPFEALLPALAPVVEEAIAHLRSDARYVLQLAAVAGRFSLEMLQAIASGEVAGSPEARRRLMRVEPAVVPRALAELEASGLVSHDERAMPPYACLGGLHTVLRERFGDKDRGGHLEAHRRAAELRLAALAGQGEVASDIVDLFATSGERERLSELLSRHGSRLELELAEQGEDARLLRWVEALEAGAQGLALPYWAEVVAGLALSRMGETERARERLDRARDKLGAERKEGEKWRWQVRLGEAQALAARAKGEYTEARSWLLRGLDQLAQTRKRGLFGDSGGEAREALALELRMALTLARLSRESASWDKTREACAQALDGLEAARVPGDDARVLELRRMLVAGAFAAGDGASLEARIGAGDGIAQVAKVAGALLADGAIERAVDAWRQLAGEEPLASLFLGRVLDPGAERQRWIEVATQSEDPWIRREAAQRRRRADEVGAEGYGGAVVAEAQAGGPGRALELARDAYRRVGARWDEVRLWLALAAAAARRADEGDSEGEAQLVRPIDGAVEAAQAMGFVVPWGFVSWGEADAERRLRTVLLTGLRGGTEKARAVCRAELERRGVDTRAVSATERPKTGAASRRTHSAGGAPFIRLTRSGSQGMSAADYQAVVNSKPATSFIVCVPDQLVLNFGRQLALGQKRVMLPLLLHLLRNPDESFSMLELAREVWDSPELTPTVQTKVKVAVSRLRALLGKSRNYIITTRKMEGGESVVAYQTAPQLQYEIIEPAPRE